VITTLSIDAGGLPDVEFARTIARGKNDRGPADIPAAVSDAVAISSDFNQNPARLADGTVVNWRPDI
jgi:hypothetical protein